MQKIQAIDCFPRLELNNQEELSNLIKHKDNTRINQITKTYQFFQGSDNRWNNAVFVSDKYYEFYHKMKEGMAPLIEALILDEKMSLK
jgi:hypothetical protein